LAVPAVPRSLSSANKDSQEWLSYKNHKPTRRPDLVHARMGHGIKSWRGSKRIQSTCGRLFIRGWLHEKQKRPGFVAAWPLFIRI